MTSSDRDREPAWWAEARWHYANVPGTTEQSLMALFNVSLSQVRLALNPKRFRERSLKYYYKNGKQRLNIQRVATALEAAMEVIYSERS